MQAKKLKKELIKKSDKKNIDVMSRFFKKGIGTYSEGDEFIGGLRNPVIRKIAKENIDINLSEIKELLKSKFHEERLLAAFILVEKYNNFKKKKNETGQKQIYEFYLKNLNGINNWDIVDTSAYQIVGDYLVDKKNERKVLYDLAKGYQRCPDGQRISSLWGKRVSILSTFAFIKNYDLKDTYKLSKYLINEEHDLMHKAVGWMLREAGKRDEEKLKKFLKENYAILPRTTLRYAIEKFDKNTRKKLLRGIFE
jgi:3-methyladenine DNA glycosylase AlkD